MEKIILIALISSAALFAGCKEEVKSADWYKEHPQEIYQVYTQCLKMSEHTDNCEMA